MPKINLKDVKELASLLPTLLNPGAGAMVKIATQAVTQGGTTTTSTTETTDETDNTKDDDAVGVAYNPAQLGPKNMRAGRLAKGGLVSHKSVFDLE